MARHGIRKVLVANRGEIACRIMRSCRALDLETVAVYSEADRSARHVEEADEAVAIGPAPVRQSYLDMEKILAAARETGADAVHPGYGFLSENPRFATAVMDAGLIWIGPSPKTIEDMGDKERARDIARAAGVPVLPGSPRFPAGDLDGLQEAAKEVGYPLLVKAAAGGGGIGMRVVEGPEVLMAVVEGTQSMASKAFGDSTVYLERYVPHGRHIEVQVFGFGNGSGIHLYDRDCSVQRRFQKVVEEAPAPDLPLAVRRLLHESAVALVHHERYRGAGTVEFIYDVEREEAYFLEMNTRIQVEHPVTEMVTGIDLVAWQILEAAGELTPVPQSTVTVTGHALEARVYAERPEKNFLPAPGCVENIVWPPEDGMLRIDSGVRSGDRVTPHYDPLVAKIVAGGPTREAALDRMLAALGRTRIEGLATNQAFLEAIIRSPEFRAGGVTTAFVTEWLNARQPG